MHGRASPFDKPSPVLFDISEIRPMFHNIGGLAKCSCYKAMGGWRKFCPLFTESWKDNYRCSQGGGTLAGDCCVPYYRYLHQVREFDAALEAIEKRFWENPEWHGIRISGNPNPEWENMIK